MWYQIFFWYVECGIRYVESSIKCYIQIKLSAYSRLWNGNSIKMHFSITFDSWILILAWWRLPMAKKNKNEITSKEIKRPSQRNNMKVVKEKRVEDIVWVISVSCAIRIFWLVFISTQLINISLLLNLTSKENKNVLNESQHKKTDW